MQLLTSFNELLIKFSCQVYWLLHLDFDFIKSLFFFFISNISSSISSFKTLKLKEKVKFSIKSKNCCNSRMKKLKLNSWKRFDEVHEPSTVERKALRVFGKPETWSRCSETFHRLQRHLNETKISHRRC